MRLLLGFHTLERWSNRASTRSTEYTDMAPESVIPDISPRNSLWVKNHGVCLVWEQLDSQDPPGAGAESHGCP